jgi:hypothetical protein
MMANKRLEPTRLAPPVYSCANRRAAQAQHQSPALGRAAHFRKISVGGAGLVKAWVQSPTGTLADDFAGLRVVQRSL